MKVEKLKNLNGQAGLIYILMLGREVTGKQIANELKESNLIQDVEPRTYAIINDLEKEGLIKLVEKKGRSKIRTSNCEALKLYYNLSKQDDTALKVKWSKKIIEIIANYIRFFIPILEEVFKIYDKNWRTVSYDDLFLRYIQFTLLIAQTSFKDVLDMIGVDQFENETTFGVPLINSLKERQIFSNYIEIRKQVSLMLQKEEKEILRDYALEHMSPMSKMQLKVIMIDKGLLDPESMSESEIKELEEQMDKFEKIIGVKVFKGDK